MNTGLLWATLSLGVNRLNKLIWRAGDVVGEELDTLKTVAERRMLSRLQSILDNVTYPLYDTLAQQMRTFSGDSSHQDAPHKIIPACGH